tara:strand:- start:285 stop:902 length:618 start_codon:yes stop_codon:yes gene_type:complete
MILISILFASYLGNCPDISTVQNFNLTEYLDKTWYIQYQQETAYLPKNTNYCVTARYNLIDKNILFYKGPVIEVSNHARKNSVNGEDLNKHNITLCARIPDINVKSKLLVAPCFLPNYFAGDYWVVAVGPDSSNYEWAIISGGKPTVQLSDGCTTKIDKVNDSGFWFFTKNKNPSKKIIDFMFKKANQIGFSTKRLNKVIQENCI